MDNIIPNSKSIFFFLKKKNIIPNHKLLIQKQYFNKLAICY